MTKILWGLLGPEKLANHRRTRTLGVAASVRAFNDLAVPGLGGIWFGKQLFLAVLGVALAKQACSLGKHIQNIPMANAVEALACWMSLNRNGWNSEPRLRGAMKMYGKNNLSFAAVRKPGFYVTQPMRTATIQPLVALGLVDASGSRFNAFTCSRHGNDFIDTICSDYRGAVEYLLGWVAGKASNTASNGKLQEVLSPLAPMSEEACEVLRERLIQGSGTEDVSDKARRRAVLTWVEVLREKPNQKISWVGTPAQLDDAHWRDLHVGALFFMVRDAAISVLDRIEEWISNQSDLRLSLDSPPKVPEIQSLRERAQAFLDEQHPDRLATDFCRECINPDSSTLLATLVKRDDRVLCLRDRFVVPGSAFRGKPAAKEVSDPPAASEDIELDAPSTGTWPEGISHRIRNLFLLNLDLHRELSGWLEKESIAGSEQ